MLSGANDDNDDFATGLDGWFLYMLGNSFLSIK